MNIATLTDVNKDIAQLVDLNLLTHIFLYWVEQLCMLIDRTLIIRYKQRYTEMVSKYVFRLSYWRSTPKRGMLATEMCGANDVGLF